MAANDNAVVIGISDYPDLGLAPLRGAVHDALEFYRWVVDEKGGAVPAENVFPFISGDVDSALPNLAQPTAKAIKDRLRALKKERTEQRGARLYIHASGHGISSVFDNEPLLVTCDASGDDVASLTPRRWADVFYHQGCYSEIILFLDACRQLEKVGYDRSVPSVNPSGDLQKRKRLYFFAVADSRPSKEISIDGRPRGLFTSLVLDGLRGRAQTVPAGPPLHNYVSSSNLIEFVTTMTPQYAKFYGLNNVDNAKLMPDVEHNDGIVRLVQCDQPLRTKVTFEKSADSSIAEILLYDNQQLMCNLPLESAAASIDLQLGCYDWTSVSRGSDGTTSESEPSLLEVFGREDIHVRV